MSAGRSTCRQGAEAERKERQRDAHQRRDEHLPQAQASTNRVAPTPTLIRDDVAREPEPEHPRGAPDPAIDGRRSRGRPLRRRGCWDGRGAAEQQRRVVGRARAARERSGALRRRTAATSSASSSRSASTIGASASDRRRGSGERLGLRGDGAPGCERHGLRSRAEPARAARRSSGSRAGDGLERGRLDRVGSVRRRLRRRGSARWIGIAAVATHALNVGSGPVCSLPHRQVVEADQLGRRPAPAVPVVVVRILCIPLPGRVFRHGIPLDDDRNGGRDPRHLLLQRAGELVVAVPVIAVPPVTAPTARALPRP